MRKLILSALSVGVVPLLSFSVLAQSSSGPESPSRSEMESVIGGMGLSMSEKLSLRKILQAMQEQGDKVRADAALPAEQKAVQIVKIRQAALDQTSKILSGPQQKQMEALLLPK